MSESASPDQRVVSAITKLWWLPLVRGVLFLILGAYALFQPGMTMSILTQVIAAFVIVDGVFTVMAGILLQVPSRGWVIGRGILEILIGVFVFGNPVIVAGVATSVLVYMLAFSAVMVGVLEIISAIQDRKHIEGEAWLFLGGVLHVLFGVLLLAAPLAFGLFLVRVLGVFTIVSGVSLIAFAFRLRAVGARLNS